MFNKSFWAMKQDLAHGHGVGFSLFGGQGVASGDKQAILDYNTALKNGVPPAKAWATTMSNASIAAQEQTRQCIKSKGSLTELANGLQQTTAKAKGAELGLKALSIAGNMLMMMGISLAISGIVKGFQALANAQENAIEKANEFISKFEEQRNILKSNKEAIDSMSADYEKLAKGVDSLGRNVSLNSNEYARYNEIVNQIANMFPHMVQGYTDEGNAIIKHKGNVEELTKAYEEQKKAAQDAIIVGSAEVFAGFKASTDKDPEYIWEESGLLQMKELVDKIVATGGDVEKIQGIINDLGGNSLVIGDVFDKIGLDKGWFDWNTQDAEYISENIKKFQSLFNTLNTEVESQAAKIKPIMQAYLEQSYEYQGLDEDVQDIVKQIVGQFDSEFYAQFDNETEMASWVTENIINKFKGKDGEKMSSEFQMMLGIQTQFNKGEITVSEYQEKLAAFLKTIEPLPDETEKYIKLLFGISTDSDGKTSSDVDTMIANVKEKFKGKFEKEIGQLTLGNLEILADLDISPEGIKDWAEVETLIANTGENLNKLTISVEELEKASDGIKTLGSAFKELSDDGHITTKTLGEIKTATGLADDEWAGYESALLNAKKGSTEFNKAMSDLTYKILEHEMGAEKLANATEEQIAAVLRENGVLNANAVAESIVIAEKNKKLSQSTELAQAYLYEKIGIEELTKKTEEEIEALLTEANIESTVEQRTYLLAQAKEALRLKTALAKATTAEEIAALAMEASQAGITGNALNDLILDMGIFNNTNIDVSQKVAALQEMGYYAHWTAQGLANIDKVKKYSFGGKDYIASYDKDGKLVGVEKEKEIDIPKVETPKITIPNYSGAASGSKSSGSKGSGSDKNEALDNYLKDAERRYKIHQDETKYINDLNYALNSLVKTEDERLDVTSKIDEAYRDLADNRIKDIEHQIELQEKLHGENVNILEDYNEIQRIASEEAARLRGLGYDDNSNEIQELQNKWWDAQNKKLDFYSKQHENIIRDIEHARDMATENNPYADITSYYQQLKDEYHKEAERLRALDPEKYKEDIQKLQLAWWDAHDAIVDWEYENSANWIDKRKTKGDWALYGDSEYEAWQRVVKWLREKYPNELDKIHEAEQNAIDSRFEHSQNWISDRNTYNDWRLFDDSEIKAWERVIKWLREDYPDELEKIKEAEQNLFDARKNRLNEANSFGSSYIESRKTLLQAYYDVTNSIAEAQHEINKELETSKTMYEWLDKDTRKLLFNQKDYNILSKELLDIQYKARQLQRQYERDLNNSTLETVESITSNYQMQYETLMKSYEIAKADLEIAKKKQQLNNVLAERNTRMFIDGQWKWVANTEDVINAKSELADAEYAKQVEEAGLTQQKSINNLTKQQDELGVVINKFENGVIDLDDAVKMATQAIGRMPKSLSSMYSDVAKSSGKAKIQSSSSSASKNNATATIPGIGTVGVHINDSGKTTTTGLPAGTVVHTGGGDYKITGGSSGNYSSIKVKNKYAGGTNNTKSGAALMGEDEFEVYIDNNGHLIPIKQPTIFTDIEAGGKVFNTEQMKNLSTLWNMSNIKIPDYSSLVNNSQSQHIDQSQDNRIIIDKMVVDSGSSDGQALISALRRYVGNH